MATVRASATPQDVHEIAKSFLDTLAVAHAGRTEPVVRALHAHYGKQPAAAEHRALCMAARAHALDFDDVQFSSLAHVSGVVIPALLAVVDDEALSRSPCPADADLAQHLASAYLAGVNVARWVGTALGPDHYRAGWHATSTIGPLAAAAAVSRYWRLTADQTAHAIALAACQASGTQRSFGTMAKPLHAGFASCAGVRAGAFARLGVTGPHAPFSGAGGFEALYAGRTHTPDSIDHASKSGTEDFPESWRSSPDPDGNGVFHMTTYVLDLARKVYPCCYGAQRLVSASLDLRARLTAVEPDVIAAIAAIERVVVTAQTGTLIPLRVQDPQDGNAAKFCAGYLIAVALLDGHIWLDHFKQASLARADVAALRPRIAVVEQGPAAASIEDGTVQAHCSLRDGTTVASRCVAYFPGSPQKPLTDQQLDDKLRDCFGGDQGAVARIKTQVRRWLGASIA